MARYALTILLSAFLLFQVQPLIAKYILPWFGGGPGIWTTCMLFFQMVLLIGYAYAHLIAARISAKRQALVHAGLVLVSLAFLPIIPSEAWKPTVWREGSCSASACGSIRTVPPPTSSAAAPAAVSTPSAAASRVDVIPAGRSLLFGISPSLGASVAVERYPTRRRRGTARPSPPAPV